MSIWKGIKLNSANAKGFLFFLLLTAILATLIKMSKIYNLSRTLAVEVVDLPLDKAVQSISPDNIVVSAQVSGFSILRNSLANATLEISYDDLVSNGRGVLEYDTSDHPSALQKAIARDASIINVKPKRIRIVLDSLASRRVPVIPKIDIQYAVGYNASSLVRVIPDSITVVGPSKQLKHITLIETKTVQREEANEDISVTVGFEIDSLMGILRFSEREVVVHQSITKFTEGRVTVPITVLNDPDSKVKILPKNVNVVYQVALDSFERVGASDFRVTCDYNNANEISDYLSLKIERQPVIAQGARLSTKQVKYIIVH